jgi:hypothetical protein
LIKLSEAIKALNFLAVVGKQKQNTGALKSYLGQTQHIVVGTIIGGREFTMGRRKRTELLHKLLVLVKLLEVFNGAVFKTNLLGASNISNRPDEADSHTRTAHNGEADGATETLVFLRIVILETDLEFNGLNKVPLLVLSTLKDVCNGLSQCFNLKFAVEKESGNTKIRGT